MMRATWLLLPLLALCWATLGALCWPYPKDRLVDEPATTWRIIDRHGELLREAVGPSGERARWARLDEISPRVIQALIAVEDQRFYAHGGIDPWGVGRALLHSARSDREGASTLTMQLARNLGGLPRTPWGKLRQLIDAVRLERATSKERILELYLNRVMFAPGTQGVEAASERLFGGPTRGLSLAQAALLAGLVQAPSAFFPERHAQRALARRAQVLGAMRQSGVISEEEHALASAEPLVLHDGRPRPEGLHFTDHVLAQRAAPGEVRTTLDRSLQAAVQRMTAEHVGALTRGGLRQAAVVVLDNERCEVLAMVGSADWWGERDGRVNGATSPRQPGSALKPFLYALAFERGWDPASVAADIPTRYLDADGLLMHPRNYAERFSGPVLLGEALGRSLNVPAVRLANAVGIEDVLALLRKAGLHSLDESAEHYGLGLVLGNGEVTLLELATAYAMLARGGVSCTPQIFADALPPPGEAVLSETAVFLVRDVLSDEGLRRRAFGYDNPLLVGFPVAVKTGTSTNWRDSWAIGFTDRHTVAVWAGDFEGAPMDRLSGALGAGPLFQDVVREVTLRGSAPSSPEPTLPPAGVELRSVCALSGAEPTEHCPLQRTMHVHASPTARTSCTWHRPLRLDRRNGLLASDRCPSRYVEERVFAVLPPTYAAWQQQDGSAPPSRWSPLCPPDGLSADAVVITHPRPDDVFLLEPGYARATQSIELSAEVDPPVPELVWWVDGQPVDARPWPYGGLWTLLPGAHEVIAVAGERRSEPVRFEVR